MIHLRNVTKRYKPDIYALKNVTVTIQPKEFVSIVGKSGTGKTTLAKLLIAQEKPNEGRIVIGDWDITDIRPYEIPILRRQIGVVFQDFNLLPQKTVFENVAFALEVLGFRYSIIKKVVPEVLEIVGLEEKTRRYPVQLSGGEQQRVVIARALVHRPKILIADEPTGNLDIFNTEQVLNLLLKINELGTIVLLITHDKDIVDSLNRRVIRLENGEIVSDEEQGKYQL
ncbi:MAG: ATP-binding cassette domain-containing protein [Parcubacteria group bacterium]|nr:ATP-binding cassette domain-containing protein [Parcubacteria group bacterium]